MPDRSRGSSRRPPPSRASIEPVAPAPCLDELAVALAALRRLFPHERGYEFERFLTRFFDAQGMGNGKAFRIRGEMIEGGFRYRGMLCPVQANWYNVPTPTALLRPFRDRLDRLPPGSLGLFISYGGFSRDGPFVPGSGAPGPGGTVTCLDGGDLHEMLSPGIALRRVLDRTLERATEAAGTLLRVRDPFAG